MKVIKVEGKVESSFENDFSKDILVLLHFDITSDVS